MTTLVPTRYRFYYNSCFLLLDMFGNKRVIKTISNVDSLNKTSYAHALTRIPSLNLRLIYENKLLLIWTRYWQTTTIRIIIAYHGGRIHIHSIPKKPQKTA